MRFRSIITTLSAFSVTACAFGQSAQIPAPPQDKTVVIHNATVHTVTNGTLEAPAYIVFDDGVITMIGKGEAPQFIDAHVFDGSGLHVYPGLILAQTTLGLTEVGSVRDTQDDREIGDFTPEVRAAVAVNPDTDLIPVTRANGILIGLTFPQGGIMSGRASSIRFDGWTWEEMAIDPAAGLVINWPRVGPAIRRFGRGGRTAPSENRAQEAVEQIDDFFDDAIRYQQAREADSAIPTDSRYEAVVESLDAHKPVFVRADSAPQVESAVAWANRRGFDIVIVGGRQCEDAIPLLARHEVPVIVSGTHRIPSRRHDDYDAAFTLPAKLHDAGVLFAIATGGEAPHERNLNHMVATAAAYGLPVDAALRSVTIDAARILGIEGAYGSLEEDKSATLIVTDGDPLEITTETFMAFIDGRTLDLGSRHKRLYDKYQTKYRQLGLIE